MVGTRANWSKVLPLLHSFVLGSKVQVFNPTEKRWVDTEELDNPLEVLYRIKKKGVWKIKYKSVVFDYVAHGEMRVIGEEDVKPCWPVSENITYDLTSLKFEEI